MSNSHGETDTELLFQLKTGDKEAANQLMSRYFERVVRAANARIAGRRLRAGDAEDIAASVFESLWKKADQNQFGETELTSANDLWRLLCKMVQYKTEDHVRREHADKRGGGKVRGESAFLQIGEDSVRGLARIPDKELTPSQIIALKENFAHLMELLKSPILEEIATRRMEEQSVAEIAAQFTKSQRWVKRKLTLIRDIWQHALEKCSHHA